MIVENVKKLRDFIQSLPSPQFKMRNWGQFCPKDEMHPCGSIACLAGNAAILRLKEEGKVQNSPDGYISIKDYIGQPSVTTGDYAQEWLGITYDQRLFLFLPPQVPDFLWNQIFPSEAAEVLDYFRETGKVDWHVVPRLKVMSELTKDEYTRLRINASQ